MTDSTEREPLAEASSGLVYQWIVSGIVSAAARFVPIPFVDDVIRQRCRQFAIARTLAAHDRSEQLDELEVYYDSSRRGCGAGCLSLMAQAPLKLLMFPVRRIVALLTSVRGVPLEIMRVVLLGRTLDRQLSRGEIDSALAARMHTAFDESFARMDVHVVRAAMNDALSRVSGWKKAAVESAQLLIGRSDARDVVQSAPPSVDAGAREVQQALESAEMLELFTRFDLRFDQALARLSAGASADGKA